MEIELQFEKLNGSDIITLVMQNIELNFVIFSIYFGQQVQKAIQNASNNPKLKNILMRLEDCPNIPRKQAKFEVILSIHLCLFYRVSLNTPTVGRTMLVACSNNISRVALM